MKKSECNALWLEILKTESNEQHAAIMKDFMFKSSLEDLLTWNRYLANKSEIEWAKHRKNGLSEEDKAWYIE